MYKRSANFPEALDKYINYNYHGRPPEFKSYKTKIEQKNPWNSAAEFEQKNSLFYG